MKKKTQKCNVPSSLHLCLPCHLLVYLCSFCINKACFIIIITVRALNGNQYSWITSKNISFKGGGETLYGMWRALKTQLVMSKYTNAFASASYSPVHRNRGGDFHHPVWNSKIISKHHERLRCRKGGTKLSQSQIQVMCKPSQGDITDNGEGQ